MTKKRNAELDSNYFVKLYTIDEMRNIIMRERARTDRSGHEFSVITFDIGNYVNNESFHDDCCHFLETRLRSIDETGWFTDGHIGIVLSYTPAKKAAKLAERFQEIMRYKSYTITVEVFAYPSIWPYKKQSDQQNECNLLEVISGKTKQIHE